MDINTRNSLYQIFDKYFSKDELKALAFQLGIEEELDNFSKANSIMSFIGYLERHEIPLTKIIEFTQENHPNIDWSTALILTPSIHRQNNMVNQHWYENSKLLMMLAAIVLLAILVLGLVFKDSCNVIEITATGEKTVQSNCTGNNITNNYASPSVPTESKPK